MKMKCLTCIICIIFGFGSAILAQEPIWLKSARSTVVMIKGTMSDGAPFSGAGIIVGISANRIYIATANHVLRPGGNDNDPSSISISFSFLRGEWFPAAALPDRSDANVLDLAVLRVSEVQAKGIPVDQISRKLRSEEGVAVGKGVHAMGYPSGNPWGTSLREELVDSIQGSRIRFQSSYVEEGHSGGAIFDECGNIVGMIVTQGAEAVPIQLVLQQLTAWGYPVDLEVSACQSTKVEIRLFNGDDKGYAYVNGVQRLEEGFARDSGWVDVTPFMQRGKNSISFKQYNDGVGWTYGFEVRKNGEVVYSKTCGQANVQGCQNNDSQIGLVFTDTVEVMLP